VHGVYDRAGASQISQYRSDRFRLPRVPRRRHPRCQHYAARYPAHLSPCQRFAATSRSPTHDSGPMWFATPSSYGSFIRFSLPILIGAFGTRLRYSDSEGPCENRSIGATSPFSNSPGRAAPPIHYESIASSPELTVGEEPPDRRRTFQHDGAKLCPCRSQRRRRGAVSLAVALEIDCRFRLMRKERGRFER